MTEYDYSPDAFKQHLDTQQRIERWVDQTREQPSANPFIPLSGEHYDTQRPHHDPHPHPAFYQGVISPTFSNPRRYERSRRRSPSPQRLHVVIPPGYGPVVGRSFSSPPAVVRNIYPLPSIPYTPYPAGSPINSSPYGSPYQSSPISYPSYSQTSFQSVPTPLHIHASPVIQQQHGVNNTYPYFQPPPPQPVVVVNRGRGDYVVIPPPNQHVQVISPYPVYETQNRGQPFFGRLKGFSMKSSKSKRSKRSRRDSY